MLFTESGGSVIPLAEIPDSTDFQKIQVPIGELASTLDSIDLRNRNTYRKVDVKDITIFDKTQRGDYVPVKSLSEAGDAQVEMDGIAVKRGTNVINDLLPGVTLTLKAANPSPVELAIKHDVEGIKKQVLNLVGSYDGIITDIDVLTRRDDTVISDAAYMSDDEKTKARANLGLFMGDLSLAQLKGSMQNVMMNPYPTSLGQDLSLLAQVGISTDTRSPGSSAIDRTRLRGYLEVDEPKLTAAIAQHAEALRELFGNDTTGDLVVDSGAAYRLDLLLRPYVQTGGILPQRATTLDSQIADSNRSIADYKVKLDDYQAELKRKYAQMGSALDNMQQNSQSINNFNKQNQRGSEETRGHAPDDQRRRLSTTPWRTKKPSERWSAASGRWLAAEGFLITGLSDGSEDLLPLPVPAWMGREIASVARLSVSATRTADMKFEHWRTVQTWLGILSDELRQDTVEGPDPLAELLSDLPKTLEGFTANPFLPPGSDAIKRFDAVFGGQSPASIRAWPPERREQALLVVDELSASLSSRLADAAHPVDALADASGSCATACRAFRRFRHSCRPERTGPRWRS